jgi:hypothetical protein
VGIAMLLEPVASAFPERTLVGSRDGGLSAGDLLALAGVRFTPLNYRLPAAQIAELAAGLGQHTVLVADEQYALAVRDVPGVDVLTTGDWLAAVIVALPDAGLDGDEVREFARARLRGCAAARLADTGRRGLPVRASAHGDRQAAAPGACARRTRQRRRLVK